MKTITLTMLVLLSITASGQQKQSTFNHARDKGRKAVIDTTKNEVVNGKYKLVVTPSKDTAKAVQAVKSLVVIDVQAELKSIRDKQIKSGQFLIGARKSRIQALAWMSTCSVVGSIVFARSNGSAGAAVFGATIFALGGTVSIVKLVDAFNKIGFAGKALID